MTQLRNLVAALFLLLLVYTLFVVVRDGANFFPLIVAEILAVGWAGQITLDLITFTTLSGLWVAWRHNFSAGGIALGLVVVVGAMLAFAPYLLYAIHQAQGDARKLLLGRMAASPA